MASASYFLLLALLISNVTAATINQTVDLGYATYQGIFDSATGVSSFLGMRYASPPTGVSLLQCLFARFSNDIGQGS